MKLLVRIVFSATLALALAAPSHAQDQTDEARKMAEMLKMTQPGDRHKHLEPLVGSWDVIVRFKYGPGPERQARASSEAKWILGGRFIQQDYKSESGQITLQFVGYDNQKKKFFEVKMDNMDTGVLYTEGSISDDGKVITNTGERTDPLTGVTGRLRTVTTLQDKDHYTVEWFYPGADGKEQKTVTMVHTRKGTASVSPGEAETREAFFGNLRKMCGRRFAGDTQFPADPNHPLAGKKLVLSFDSCSDREIRIPFLVGEDKSRTWILTLSEKGLLFKHDHRHPDGTPDRVTMYGGWAAPGGTSHLQRFPADPDTAKLIPEATTNVWTLEILPEKQQFIYYLERNGQPRYRAVFNLKPLSE